MKGTNGTINDIIWRRWKHLLLDPFPCFWNSAVDSCWVQGMSFCVPETRCEMELIETAISRVYIWNLFTLQQNGWIFLEDKTVLYSTSFYDAYNTLKIVRPTILLRICCSPLLLLVRCKSYPKYCKTIQINIITFWFSELFHYLWMTCMLSFWIHFTHLFPFQSID